MGNENYLPPPPGEKVSGRTWLAVLASLLGAFMAVLDIAITNSSLKDILGALSATQEEGSWISSAYLVAEIVVIPLAGFLAMVFSTRRYLVANVALFLIFSTLCGMAWSLESMIAFRAAQGFTGGVMIPMAMTLVTRKLPLKKRPIGLALFGMTATLAPTLGPTVGGYLTELYGWPSIFYINWAPGILLMLGVSIGLDREPMNLKMLRDVDWMGIVFMAVGLGSLTAMLEEGNSKDWFQSRFIITAAVLAIGGIYGWAWRGLTRKNTFIDLHILGRPSFLIAGVIAFTTGMGLYGSAFILPLYLGQIANYTPMQIGLVIMWMGLPQLFIMPFAARLSTKLDNRVMMSLGLALFATSCFMNTHMSADTAGPELLFAQIVRALGQPLIMITLTNFAVNGIPPHLLPSASGMFNMMRNLGGSVGIATLATLLTNREHLHSARVGEAVSLYDPATQARLDTLAQNFASKGIDLATAQDMAIKALDNVVRRDSFVMAYNDAFLVLGIALFSCVAIVWLSKKVLGGAGAAEAAH
ncbi:MAG: DHA2 family efflux MFS transporter permease subunit [Burkholderiales bacterium]|nr:DHA2 family efflux MFS transporter permease subunit [Burkholderiales bacterium]